MNVFYSTLLLLLLVLIELVAIRLILKEPIPWKEVTANLNSGHILLWIFRGLEIVVYDYSLRYLGLGLIDSWPLWAIYIFAFVAWDFCFYWLHRLHHQWPALWAIHEVHHQGEYFSLSLGIRNSWFSSLTSIPFFTILAVVGVPLEVFIVVSSLHYVVQFYNHNRIVNKSGWLEYVLITPSHHRVHHGKNKEYINKNHSGTLVIWDKLFGTFQEEREDIVMEYGIRNPVNSHNPLWQNGKPIVQWLGKYKVWPLKSSFSPKQFSSLWIGLGGILLFMLLLVYIYYETQWPASLKAVFFSYLFMNTLANGGLSDGKSWALYAWLLFSVLGGAGILFFYADSMHIIAQFLLIFLAFHAFMGLFIHFYRKQST
ncbi:sterol desaturase family protein [Cytophagales bacterium LB-30]|uniref:Sterol desaturase family protein n=1 Tax=Shiella aurantiaca TaxID=3058365 RepID=A0ABT8F595_9BACT|nr:sterol desaturase family protein [Shiella aurantiaca]MDN4165141.1 sterol desaturase family protein [Shiella aurantiaca]